MTTRQYFRISPKGASDDMVLVVYGRHAGARVMLFSPKEANIDSQLFYEDPRTATIRNKINDHCLDVNRRGFLVVNPYRPDAINQQWRIKGETIQNGEDDNRVLDVSGYWGLVPGCIPEATTHTHNGPTQKWTFTAA